MSSYIYISLINTMKSSIIRIWLNDSAWHWAFKEDDFENASFIFECLSHTGAALRGMLAGSPAENRTWALVNESMVCRYCEEFATYIPKHYKVPEDALEFFSVHWVADQDHTQRAAQVVKAFAKSPQEQNRVRLIAKHAVRFKIAKFDGIYREYA